MNPSDAQHLKTIEQRLLWLSHWMIHNANHIRPKVDGIKIGGHQASSASMVSIMTALYFSRAAARGPGRGQAACLAGLSCDPVSDGQSDAREDGEFPRLRRRAKLSEPDQGRG